MSNRLRVISYNIRYNNPKDGNNAWPYRKERVAALLHYYAPDLIGLQEVLKTQLDDLAERLSAFAWVGVGRDDGQTAGEYAPIFYRRDGFDLVGTGNFWLSATPHEPGTLGWDADCVRLATWARLRHKASDKTLLMLNTHFDHRGERAQVESALLLRRFLNDPAQRIPALVTGDFNRTAQSWAYEILTVPSEAAGFPLLDTMLYTQMPHQGPRATWANNFSDPLDGKIDFIFIWQMPPAIEGTMPTLQVHQHAILADQSEGRYPSDHLPVMAEIEVR